MILFFHKLAEHKSFCEELLQVILQKPNLNVVENIPQRSIRNIKGRSVIVDVYVVYISSADPFLKGKTIYHVERRICETGEIVENGFHEIYVNTKIDDGSDIAKLMEIFTSSQIPENQKFPKICQTIKYYKEGKGQREMNKVMEEYAKEYAEEYAEKYAKNVVVNMLQRDMELEVISQCTKMPKEKIIQIQKELVILRKGRRT